MRLIDGDALANKIISLPKKRDGVFDEMLVNAMLWHISQAPTIEAEICGENHCPFCGAKEDEQ